MWLAHRAVRRRVGARARGEVILMIELTQVVFERMTRRFPGAASTSPRFANSCKRARLRCDSRVPVRSKISRQRHRRDSRVVLGD